MSLAPSTPGVRLGSSFARVLPEMAVPWQAEEAPDTQLLVLNEPLAAELARITAPTLVVHGDRDLMVHPTGGRATADAIPGARHVEVAGMGHHLAPGVVDRLVELTTDLVQNTAGGTR